MIADTPSTPSSPDAADTTVTPAPNGADVRKGGRGSLNSTRIHMNVDVKGVLLRWSPANFKKHWRGFFRHDDGRAMTEQEAKSALIDELAQGHEHIPVGGPCESFDYKKGCPGHHVETAVEPDTPRGTNA